MKNLGNALSLKYIYLCWPMQVSSFTPLTLFFSYVCCFGFIAFMPLVHVVWHIAAQNSVSWRLSKDSNQRANPKQNPLPLLGQNST